MEKKVNYRQRLLNALRVRMGWLGYQFGHVMNPFESRFCLAVKNPDGKARMVFIDRRDTDYDVIAEALHRMPDLTEIEYSETQEAASDG